MKKTVKGLIIAASVAAVVGVGAVSYAAWNAGTDNTKTVANNTLGNVSVLKFDGKVTTSKVENLLPIDQNTDTYDKDNNPLYGVTEFQIVKSVGYQYSDFKLEVKIEKGEGIDSDTTFYVSKTAPTDSSKGTAIGESGATLTYSIADSGNYTLYVCHDSNNMADMNKSFTLNLKLIDGTTPVSGS